MCLKTLIRGDVVNLPVKLRLVISLIIFKGQQNINGNSIVDINSMLDAYNGMIEKQHFDIVRKKYVLLKPNCIIQDTILLLLVTKGIIN